MSLLQAAKDYAAAGAAALITTPAGWRQLRSEQIDEAIRMTDDDRDPDPTIEDVPLLDGDAPDEPPSPTDPQADETPRNDEVQE